MGRLSNLLRKKGKDMTALYTVTLISFIAVSAVLLMITTVKVYSNSPYGAVK